MISVTADRSPRTYNLRMSGHANFDKIGRDIVCAAASMAWTMLRSELEWVQENCDYRCRITHHEDDHICWIRVSLPEDGEPEGMIPERVDDSIHMFLMGIQTLQNIHPECVRMKVPDTVKLADPY